MKKIYCLILTSILSQLSYGQSDQPTSSVDAKVDKIDKWIAAVDLHTWSTYADSIKNCTQGTFVLVNPMAMGGAVAEVLLGADNSMTQDQFNQKILNASMTYQIIGMDNDKCRVKMKITAADIPPPDGNAHTLDCAIPKDSLPVISQAAQALTSYHKDALSNGALDGNDASAKVLDSACVLSTGQ